MIVLFKDTAELHCWRINCKHCLERDNAALSACVNMHAAAVVRPTNAFPRFSNHVDGIASQPELAFKEISFFCEAGSTAVGTHKSNKFCPANAFKHASRVVAICRQVIVTTQGFPVSSEVES
eukprot:TRINITY_DN13848_c0_g2_i1.p2 TRINITY_DN13848_c0_g2~~TRINITY_DN13848_c0_g2_i1.p2  ORF type:complete len:122 (-),score=6.52 TRINITY_DN13848_c0_g2_i1:24-389(-)